MFSYGAVSKEKQSFLRLFLLVPTKRVLTSLRLCGYMLYVKVYCTSGALCRICALLRCWPLFANRVLLRMGKLVSSRLTSRSAAGHRLHSLPTQRGDTAICHIPLTQRRSQAGHICKHNLYKEQSQKAGSVHLSMQELFFSFTCIYSFFFIQQWKFDCIRAVMCFSRTVIQLLKCQLNNVATWVRSLTHLLCKNECSLLYNTPV